MPGLPLGAVIAFDFKAWDLGEEIAILHQARACRVQVYRNYTEDHLADHVQRTLNAEGFTVDSLHGYFALEGFEGPPCDLSAEDEAERGAALEIMRGEAQYARALGCTDIIIHPAGLGRTEDDPFRPDALARSAETLARIGEAAGARFLLENMPPLRFGRDAQTLRRIVDRIAGPNLGLAFDSGHAVLASDPVEVIHTMGPRIWGIHLHDNLGDEDAHLLPGMGIIDFEAVARALADVGFGGTFLLEIYRPTDEVRRDLTPERLAYIGHLRRIASGPETGNARNRFHDRQ